MSVLTIFLYKFTYIHIYIRLKVITKPHTALWLPIVETIMHLYVATADSKSSLLVAFRLTYITRGLISLWLYKEHNKLRD
jgi:hypothetical protein